MSDFTLRYVVVREREENFWRLLIGQVVVDFWLREVIIVSSMLLVALVVYF